MKYLNTLAALLFVVFFLGCASSPATRLQVQRAPEIIIPDAKTVRINRFDISSNAYRSNLASIHRTDLQTALFNKKTFKVVSNGPADIILGGTVNFITNDDVRRSEGTDSEGKRTVSHSATRNGRLQVQLVVTDSSGEMVGTSNFDIVEQSSGSGKYEYQAKQNLKSNYDMFASALKKSVPKIVRRVTPYTESVYRTFAEAENEQFEAANEYAEKGLWEQALNGWIGAESSGTEAKAASYYNQSIYHEQKGNLDKANELIQKAVALKSTATFVNRQRLISKLIF